MAETWLSYRQLGELWKTTPEAARARARRGRFPRRTNNVGAVEILVDTDAPVPESRGKAQGGQTRTATLPNTPGEEAASATTAKALEALEGHVATLLDQLAKAEALASDRGREVAAERERVADLTAQLLRLTADLLDARKAESAPRLSWWQRLVG